MRVKGSLPGTPNMGCMDINLLRIAVTVVSFAVFLGIVWFAVNPRNRQRFDEAARLPLGEDDRG